MRLGRLLLLLFVCSVNSTGLQAHSSGKAGWLVMRSTEKHQSNCTVHKQPPLVRWILQQSLRLAPDDGEAVAGGWDWMAIASLGCAVLAITLTPVFPYAGILAVPAVVFGIISIPRTGPGKLKGRGMAIAGLSIGGALLLFQLLAAAALLALLVLIFGD